MKKQYNKISGTSAEIKIMLALTVFLENVKPTRKITYCFIVGHQKSSRFVWNKLERGNLSVIDNPCISLL